MSQMEMNILHLYPDLLNLYGDKGNLCSLKKRLEWRGITAHVIECCQEDDLPSLSDIDLILLGGGSDREEARVCDLLTPHREELLHYIEDDGVLLALCGGFPMLGRYTDTEADKPNGLGLLEITTRTTSRWIDHVILDSPWSEAPLVGFENHATKTDIGRYQPLGKLLRGSGNDGESGQEGLVYKNVLASYLHGPLLPKNPALCDELLTRALRKKYPDFIELSPLNDETEDKANQEIRRRFAG